MTVSFSSGALPHAIIMYDTCERKRRKEETRRAKPCPRREARLFFHDSTGLNL